jgi:hypothetical protein
MGKMLYGINGPIIGKVGSVVCYVAYGESFVRGLSTRPKKPPTVLQRQQHAKFSLMNKFLKDIIPLLNQTNKSDRPQVSGYNKAHSYNVKNAFKGQYPDLAIDFDMVLLSRGDLPNVKDPGVELLSEGQIRFSWTDNSGSGMAHSDDQAFVAVYSEELGTWEYGLNLGTRSSKACIFKRSHLARQQVQIYIGFLSADGNEVTNSLYAGFINAEKPVGEHSL